MVTPERLIEPLVDVNTTAVPGLHTPVRAQPIALVNVARLPPPPTARLPVLMVRLPAPVVALRRLTLVAALITPEATRITSTPALSWVVMKPTPMLPLVVG